MTIPAELLNTWKGLRSSGDSDKMIPGLTAKQRVAISRAFNRGTCPDDLFPILKKFYLEKEKTLFPEKFIDNGK